MKSGHGFLDYLEDIQSAIEKIEQFTAGMTYQGFSEDDKTIFAVIRAFEIIGEAAKNIPSAARRRYKKIPWKEMTGMRDKVIHDYSGVDIRVIWDTVQEEFPSLKLLISQAIEQEIKKEQKS